MHAGCFEPLLIVLHLTKSFLINNNEASLRQPFCKQKAITYLCTHPNIFSGVQKALCRPGADLVICDEGHRIKNDQANISQALKKIHTRYVNSVSFLQIVMVSRGTHHVKNHGC